MIFVFNYKSCAYGSENVYTAMPSVLFEMLSLHFMNFQGFLFDVCLYLIIIHIKEVSSFTVCVFVCVGVQKCV